MSKIKIIISRTDKIGDLILSIPSFKMVRNIFPESHIIVLVRKYNYDIIKNLPYIDETIKIDDYNIKQLAKYLRNQNPLYFISLYTDKNIGYLARKSKAKYRIGPYSKLHSFFSYNKGMRQNRSKSIKNEAEYNLDLIKIINPEQFHKKFEIETRLYVEEKYQQKARKLFEGKVGKTVLIHPFSGNSGKNLSYEQYGKIIRKLLIETDYSIIVSCHISDEKTMKKYFGSFESERVQLFINEESIMYLAAIIQQSDIFVGSSTGPTHIAGSLQKPIVAFYPSIRAQSVTRWGVFNNSNVTYFGNRINCPEKFGCRKNCPLYNCFDKIDISEVVKTIIKKIEENEK